MDEDVSRDEEGDCHLGEQQDAASSLSTASTSAAAATSAQLHSCAHYEPHYQQMHPSLIYYDEQAYLHHHHLHHHHSHLTNRNHNHNIAAAAAVVAAVSGNNHPLHQQHWEHHQEHYVHMPIMIPFGDTSSPNCLSVLAPTTEQALNENEPVNVSPSFRLKAETADRKATEGQEKPIEKKVDEDENCSAIGELVQSREMTSNESLSGVTLSTPTTRELHNEIERRRRSRIKHCCEVLKTLVPGLSEKTDKATVLEHTVSFVARLIRECQASECNCGVVVNEDE